MIYTLHLAFISDAFKFSFFPRTIVAWNALPVTLVASGWLIGFRGGTAGAADPLFFPFLNPS